MKLPQPVAGDGLRKTAIQRFDGFRALATEGGVCAMENMSSEFWPELASRPKRKKTADVTDPRGIGVWNEICWADGTDFHYGQTTVSGMLADLPKHTFAQIGDLITIWPDKKWYDTVAGTHGDLEARYTAAQAEDVWFLSRQAASGVSTQANCIEYKGASDLFRPGDAVEISGCTAIPENNRTVIVREVADAGGGKTDLITYDDGIRMNGRKFWKTDDDYPQNALFCWIVDEDKQIYNWFYTGAVVDVGTYLFLSEDGKKVQREYTQDFYTVYSWDPDQPIWPGWSIKVITWSDPVQVFGKELNYYEPGLVTLARTVPDMDFVFQHENRLFGCSGDTIYASKLGDPFNWNVYDGLASDSWAADSGTPGGFVGGISYGGYPRFFKERNITTLFGDYPSEYQLQTQELIGVESGSGESLAAANGRLYYLSVQGPAVYAGGAPQLIADAFGTMQLKDGVSGTDGRLWFLSALDADGGKHLFVFDTQRGLWTREDDLRPEGFAWYAGDVYAMSDSGELWIMGRARNAPAGAEDEGDVEWSAELGDIAQGYPGKKRITQVQIRLMLEDNAGARVLIKYDSEPDWRTAGEISARRKRSAVIPVIPKRHDHFRLKVEGTGEVRISSIAYDTARGSDR